MIDNNQALLFYKSTGQLLEMYEKQIAITRSEILGGGGVHTARLYSPLLGTEL